MYIYVYRYHLPQSAVSVMYGVLLGPYFFNIEDSELYFLPMQQNINNSFVPR